MPVASSASIRRLLILGDFFHTCHSQSSCTLDALAAWREHHRELGITLVRGNHDRHAGDPPSGLRVECVEEPFVLGPFAFSHFPTAPAPGEFSAEPRELYNIAAHLHPAVSMGDGTGSRLRAPCFWFNDAGLVLPAFGSFTGCFVVKPLPGDRVFLVGGNEIVEAPVPRRKRAGAAR
jgi:metallophosphoesterase superfamily enzyme